MLLFEYGSVFGDPSEPPLIPECWDEEWLTLPVITA